MNDGRWSEVKTILAEVLECSVAERSAALNRLCGGDAELRQSVESLLKLETRADAVMNSAILPGAALQAALRLGNRCESAVAPANGAAHLLTGGAPDASGGVMIGHYRLQRKLGEGGMGEVWLAAQEEPVRRLVALKLIKAGMNTREVIARFESERQALALMDHPAIAKVFDAGSTAQGAPYFSIEYIDGVPITAYCDSRHVAVRERLELFLLVCEGVQHAHQKGIIHRDLKPSNILVTEVDGRPAPKIIDFGVAKALTRRLAGETMVTRFGTLVGTPEYMSPEQAASSGEDIDTRSDVYSLGVVLYEILAGALPLDWREIAFDEFLRSLRLDEPPKPSTRIRSREHARALEISRRRQTDPSALARLLRGDLDSIVLKALEKDRSRRYGSPSELAADLVHYLKREPVLAVAPSAAYRARKFAHRHRPALATACAFLLVLIAAAGVNFRESIRANREAAVAQAVNDFLQKDLLAQASAANQSGPRVRPDRDLKVRTALDRAAARINSRFDHQPQVEAAIRDTIGQTYMDLGLYSEARAQLQRAFDLYSRAAGPEDPATVAALGYLGYTAYLQGSYAEAERLLSRTVEVQRRILGAQHPDTVTSLKRLAIVYGEEGKYPQAGDLLQRILQIQRRTLGPEKSQTLAVANNLADVYEEQGEYALAEDLHRQTLAIQRRVLGPEHPNTLSSMNNLANVYLAEGKFAEAEALDHQTLEIRRRILGPEHPYTLTSMSNLADVYAAQGKYTQAEGLHVDTVAISRRVLGPQNPSTLAHMNNLADIYAAEGKYAQAEALFRQILDIRRRTLGPEHPYTLYTLASMTFLYQIEGNYASAETYAAQALSGRRHKLGSEDPDTMDSAADLALAYESQGNFAAAEPLAREATETDRRKRPNDWQRFRAESVLGACLAGQKKYSEAEPLLLEGYRGMLEQKDRMPVPDQYHLRLANDWIHQLYRAWGSPEPIAKPATTTVGSRRHLSVFIGGPNGFASGPTASR